MIALMLNHHISETSFRRILIEFSEELQRRRCKTHLPIYELAADQKYLLESQCWQFYEKRHQININYRHT